MSPNNNPEFDILTRRAREAGFQVIVTQLIGMEEHHSVQLKKGALRGGALLTNEGIVTLHQYLDLWLA